MFPQNCENAPRIAHRSNVTRKAFEAFDEARDGTTATRVESCGPERTRIAIETEQAVTTGGVEGKTRYRTNLAPPKASEAV